MKKMLKSLVISESVTCEPFLLKEIKGHIVDKDTLSFVLADASGDMPAEVSTAVISEAALSQLNNTVVAATGIVLARGRVPYLKVTELSVAEKFVSAEVLPGLPKAKVEECISDIHTLMGMIQNPHYAALVRAALTEENLRKLATLPATLNYYGRYNGGALAATNAVARMVTSSMASYTKRGNGMTTKDPSWSCLISASLLFTFGRMKYYTSTAPYKKSSAGAALGYFPCLQSCIEDVIRANNIPITQDEISLLLNVLNVSVSDKTEAKAVSKDGTILRHIIGLYAECDAYDWEIATADDTEDSIHYSGKLKRYVVKPDFVE